MQGNSIRWSDTRMINGPFSAHAETGMSCVGRSSDFRVRSSRPSRRDSSDIRNHSCDNGLKNGGPSFTFGKALGYSGGGRPGITPGSLYVGPPTGAADHQRPIQASRMLLNAKGSVKWAKIKKCAGVLQSPWLTSASPRSKMAGMKIEFDCPPSNCMPGRFCAKPLTTRRNDHGNDCHA